jgi:hypothetical protein
VLTKASHNGFEFVNFALTSGRGQWGFLYLEYLPAEPFMGLLFPTSFCLCSNEISSEGFHEKLTENSPHLTITTLFTMLVSSLEHFKYLY